MTRLEANWLTDGLIDFEYKKYLLLSYFKEVKGSFNKLKLYPFLADLVFHYNNILDFKKNKTLMQDKFPGRLKEVDLKKLELIYEQLIKDDQIMNEIEEIIEYALPLFKENLNEGKEIYEFVEKNCEVTTVGLMPLYADEGYFFIEQNRRSQAYIYRYQMTVFENATENMRGIHTEYISAFSRGLGETYESKKLKLSKSQPDLPNPAVFLINTKLRFPKKSTLLPVVKRLLVRYISMT
ncbi:hypothetical protein E1176_05585 [Fulvivirga sp. RKSG066]|uniref:hypothetical protein n=1 Tax=Fulvivirga aurantia TaxID=2529383 RepID=UPI0012BBACEC|nr:hypothetical protein [Fulvivirga aurantia]MTI20488.1 hypothetical protein [Fulvivirga aurantia]